MAPVAGWFLPEADSETKVSVPESVRESPPIEEKEGRKQDWPEGKSEL